MLPVFVAGSKGVAVEQLAALCDRYEVTLYPVFSGAIPFIFRAIPVSFGVYPLFFGLVHCIFKAIPFVARGTPIMGITLFCEGCTAVPVFLGLYRTFYF